MRLLSILSAVLCWLCLAAPADAQPNANYTAEVEIDVTSADAATARDKGMKQAYRGAFLAVARNLTSNDGVERLNSLTDDQLLNFISEAEVLSEKASDVRYMARLKVQINGELLKAYMQEQGIPLIVVTSANVIVAGMAQRAGHPIHFMRFLLWSLPVMLVSVAMAALYLHVIHFM